jgi:predicted nucleic acid-binding protein
VILADTSAWVEFDRATGSDVHLRVRELIADGRPLAVTEPVAMEVLVGARDERRARQLRSLLARCELVSFQSPGDFDGAVAIYRRCRVRGVTPRGIVDCMIAAVAARTHSVLLACDRDLIGVAVTVGIDLDPASPSGPAAPIVS